MRRQPDELDRHIASQLVTRREKLGISQKMVGVAVGVSYQQIQKFEDGKDCIGASQLAKAADVLKTTLAYFYGDLWGTQEPAPVLHAADGEPVGKGSRDALSAEDRQLVDAFNSISDARVRRHLRHLMSALAQQKSGWDQSGP